MWWKQVLEMAQTLLRLTDDLKQTRADVKELRREMDETSDTIKRLAFELKRMQESEAAERKILKLELENHLLRAERGLPPKRETDDAPE